MKLLRNLLIIFVLLVVVLVVARNPITKFAVTQGTRAAVGLQLDVDKVNIGLQNTLLGVENIKLYNPTDFKDPVMVHIPEVFVDYEPGPMMKGNVHLTEARFHLKEVYIVKNAEGELNIDALKAVQQKKEEAGKPEKKPGEKPREEKAPEIRIDHLSLKVGKVIFKDYSVAGEPKVNELNLGLDMEYKNIKNVNELVSLVLLTIMNKAPGMILQNFDMKGLEGILGTGLSTVTGTATKAIDGTTDILKGTTDSLKGTTDELKEKAKELKDIFKGF